jgi:hypothetical protein
MPIISPTIPIKPNITFDEAIGELHHYHFDAPQIEWKVISQSRTQIQVGINGSLYERKFSEEATLPIVQTSSGNWKLGLGIGIGAAAVIGGIYGMHRLGWLNW